MKQRDKEKTRKIAEAQIKELFDQAAKSEDLKLSKRYVELALNISTKTKTPVPRELKRRFCKNCHSYLVPGRNCRVRVSKGKVVYYCLNCKHFQRFIYRKLRGSKTPHLSAQFSIPKTKKRQSLFWAQKTRGFLATRPERRVEQISVSESKGKFSL